MEKLLTKNKKNPKSIPSFIHRLTKTTAPRHISSASTSLELRLLAAPLAVGTGAVGDVVVLLVVEPVDFVIVELEVGEAVELAVRSVDGIEVEGAVEVLDPMLAVAEDKLAVVDEATVDKVPDATLD